MKMLKVLAVSAGIIIASLAFQSCLDDDGYSLDKFWVDVATLEADGSGSHYFRLDDGATLWPANIGYYTGHNLTDGQRALLNYTILSDSLSGFTHYVKVNGVDPILTKPMAEDLWEKNDSIYGVDPVRIKDLWIGDGYLNVWFIANFGGVHKHFVNLIPNTAVNTPYYFEFRHHAKNDPPVTSSTGLVCFDLSSIDTGGEEVELTIKVNTFEGDKLYKLKYNSGVKAKGKSLPSDIEMGYFQKIN